MFTLNRCARELHDAPDVGAPTILRLAGCDKRKSGKVSAPGARMPEAGARQRFPLHTRHLARDGAGVGAPRGSGATGRRPAEGRSSPAREARDSRRWTFFRLGMRSTRWTPRLRNWSMPRRP